MWLTFILADLKSFSLRKLQDLITNFFESGYFIHNRNRVLPAPTSLGEFEYIFATDKKTSLAGNARRDNKIFSPESILEIKHQIRIRNSAARTGNRKFILFSSIDSWFSRSRRKKGWYLTTRRSSISPGLLERLGSIA